MFFTAATAVSVLGALSAFGTVEASLSSRGGNSKSSCQSGYFYYDRLSCCLKSGGESTSAPSGSSCPSNFYWHTTEKCCVPKTSDVNQQVPSSCPSGSSWSNVSWCCKSTTTSSSSSCTGNKFFWGALNMCVSSGSSNENPPSGSSCPNNWSWLSSKSCCKPNSSGTSTSTTPTCNSSWTWHPGKQCCVPGESTPTPSNAPGTYGRKRHAAVHKRTNFCPNNYESCPILNASGKSTESECLDTRTELTSCGGCTSIGKGQDCSAIPYSKISTCQAGRCVVEKCKAGYEISASGDSCVSQGHAML